MSWKTIGEKAKFEFVEKDDRIAGKLLASRPTRFDCNVYDLQNDDGDHFYFFGCAMLDTILPELVGQKIQITYKGKVELDAGRTMRDYDVEVWEDEGFTSTQDEGPGFS